MQQGYIRDESVTVFLISEVILLLKDKHRYKVRSIKTGTDSYMINSVRLHHFLESTFFIISSKDLPQAGNFSNMRDSLQRLVR